MRCPRSLLLGLVAAGLTAATAAPAGAATDATLDGPVYALARDGGRVLVSGAFTHVGRPTGSAVLVDRATRALDARFPRIDGQVSVAVADGAGGVYAGGEFVRVGPLDRGYLVHLLADGTVDARFDTTQTVKGFVGALVLRGAVLYVAGKPAGRDGSAGVTAVNATTGAAVPGFTAPALPFGRELALQGNRLYVGSDSRLDALDATTGLRDPAFAPPAGIGPVSALLATPDRLYVGNGRLEALDPVTGAPAPGFSASTRGSVDVLLRDGARLYVGTSYSDDAGGTVTVHDAATGARDGAFSAASAQSVVALALTPEGLWTGGAPVDRTGTEQSHVLLLDPATGARRSATTTGFDGRIDTLVPVGTSLFTGGEFGAAGTQQRRGLAAFDLASGALDPTFGRGPQTIGGAPLEAIGGSRLYGWQGFGPLDGNPGAADDNCGDADPGTIVATGLASGQRAPGFVKRTISRPIALDATASVLADVRQIGPRRCSGRLHAFGPNRLELRSPRTGALLVSRALPFPGYVSDVVVLGSSVYVSGSFRRFRTYAGGIVGPAHLAVLKLSARTGRLDARFDTHAHGPVYSLATGDGSLYLSGLFDNLDSVERPGLAKVDGTLGALTATFLPTLRGDANTFLSLPSPKALVLGDETRTPRRVDALTGRTLSSGPRVGAFDEQLVVDGRVVSSSSPYRFAANGGEKSQNLLTFGTP